MAAAADPNALSINIDGRNVFSNPTPLLRSGRTFVPLRGVLENLGAKVDYIASERRVNIARGAQNVQLFLGTTRATIDGRQVEVEKPLLIDGRAFVPLRAVSELFGLKVSWLAATRTVAIYTGAPSAQPLNKRAELQAAGPFGLTVDFTQYPVEQIPGLLDSAKEAGVGLIKFRFDWGTLQPTKGSAFEWAYFDTILREARARSARRRHFGRYRALGFGCDFDLWRRPAPKPAASRFLQCVEKLRAPHSWTLRKRRAGVASVGKSQFGELSLGGAHLSHARARGH